MLLDVYQDSQDPFLVRLLGRGSHGGLLDPDYAASIPGLLDNSCEVGRSSPGPSPGRCHPTSAPLWIPVAGCRSVVAGDLWYRRCREPSGTGPARLAGPTLQAILQLRNCTLRLLNCLTSVPVAVTITNRLLCFLG